MQAGKAAAMGTREDATTVWEAEDSRRGPGKEALEAVADTKAAGPGCAGPQGRTVCWWLRLHPGKQVTGAMAPRRTRGCKN